MFHPIPLYIGLRYTRAKRNNHFISFVSLTSMLGIALGVAVLITVLSVMNGFDEELQQRFFGMAAQLTVSTVHNQLGNWQGMRQQMLKRPDVLAAAPFAGGQAMLNHNGNNMPIILSGIAPKYESSVSVVAEKMMQGSIQDLKPGKFGIVIGYNIAMRLGATLGDKVMVMIPQATVSPLGMQPRFKRFKVVGVFHAGRGFGFDERLALINLRDAQKLYLLGEHVTGLRLRVNNVYQAPFIAAKIDRQLAEDYHVSDWTQTFGAFFRAVKLEKTMMFIILCLIIVVAAWNLVSSLVMVVTDKQADIAILRTIGAEPKTILQIFIVQGVIVGVIGILLGLLGGLILAWNVTTIVNWLQSTLHMELFTSNVYFMDYLPSKINMGDILQICAIALVFSLFATLYPAWKAARVQPAEALRYE